MNLSKILFFLLITQIFCFKDHYGQTFIWTRPLYSFFSIQQNMWFDLTFNRCNKFFQFIGLEQKTVKSKFLNKYFFFNKPEVYITSKNANIPETERIRSQWLDIEGDFEGSFSIEPEAERKGFLAMWRIDNLGKDRQHRISFLNNSWIAVMLPFEFVKHKLNTYYKSSKKDELIKSLNNYKYQKLSPKTDSIGPSELRLILGFDFCSNQKIAAFFDTFLGIPLEPKPKNINLFEAVRGYTKNISWGGSLYTTFLLNCSCNSELRFFLAMQNVYLIPNNQYRTLNLFGKPVSRYIRFVNKNGEKNLPGIDILTQYCKVSPYNIGDISAGFILKFKKIISQINYGFWVRGHEKVSLINEWPKDYYGVDAQVDGKTVDGFPLTASKSSASFLAEPDKNLNNENVFIPVQYRDLDFLSAGSRGTMVQRLEYSLGWEDYKRFFSLGSYYEFNQNNCSIPFFGIWGKFGFIF